MSLAVSMSGRCHQRWCNFYVVCTASLSWNQWLKCHLMLGNTVPVRPVIEIPRSHTSHFIKVLRHTQAPVGSPKADLQFPHIWFSTLTTAWNSLLCTCDMQFITFLQFLIQCLRSSYTSWEVLCISAHMWSLTCEADFLFDGASWKQKRTLFYIATDSEWGQVSLRLKSEANVYPKSKLKAKLDLMSAVWSKSGLKSLFTDLTKVWCLVSDRT